MDESIITAIREYSNTYAQSLWQRFVSSQAASLEEKAIFQKLYRMFPVSPDMEMLTGLPGMALSDILDALPISFFRPGTAADIFINCHSCVMNNFIHAHDFFEMIYVCKGEILDWVDGIEIPLKQGELCIHNPNARHTILEMDDNKDFVMNVLLPPETFRRSFYSTMHQNRQLDEFFHNFVLSPDNSANYMAFHNTSPRIDIIMELLAEEFLRGAESSRFVLESTLVVLFGELIRNFKPDPFLQKLVDFIQRNLSDIDITSAARYFGYHKNYFPNIVKERTGHTFLELVTDLRLQKSITLLLFSEQSIEEISEAVGYKSTASFYRHFKKAHDMTPNEYRKKSRR